MKCPCPRRFPYLKSLVDHRLAKACQKALRQNLHPSSVYTQGTYDLNMKLVVEHIHKECFM